MDEAGKSGMQCQEFDALLSEAVDGSLAGAELARFEAHRSACPTCGPMFVEAQRGRKLLRGLVEIEPPANFVHNVLAATVGRIEEATPAARAGESWWEALRARLRMGPVLQPRFVMSFAMAFFSISLIMSLAGVKVGSLRRVDLSPSAIVRGAYEAQGRIVKYYENIRFVYEIESRLQELKRATTSEESNPPEQKKKDNKNDHPEQNKNRDTSWQPDSVTMARLYAATDVASGHPQGER
jgi:Putative zinc-finger